MNDSEDAQKQEQTSEGGVAVNPGEHLTPAQPATEEQLQQAEQKIEERMSAFERSTLKLTRIGLFVGAVTLVIFAGQLWEMNQSGKQTDKLLSAAKALAGAAGDTATAAGDQVDAGNNFADSAEEINRGVTGAVDQLKVAADNAKTGLNATREAFQLEQRAWVSIPDMKLVTLEANKPAYVEITLLNTGKTVTQTGTVAGSIYLPTDEMRVFKPYKNKPAMRLPVLFPSTINFLPFPTDRPITDTERNEVIAGSRFLYVWANITYFDVFGMKPHHTGFCGRYVPATQRFEHCTYYEDYAD